MWEAYDLKNEDFLWKEKCEKYVEFMIDKLYALEEDKGLFVQA